MSRDQFLAELTQYLTFVSPADRSRLVSAFAEKFDSVGTAGEAALIMELGTPMSIAIALKRRKEAGELILSDAPAEEAELPPEEPPPRQDEAAVPEPPVEETALPEESEEAPTAEAPAVEESVIEENAAEEAPLFEAPSTNAPVEEDPRPEEILTTEADEPDIPAEEPLSTDDLVNRILAEEAQGADTIAVEFHEEESPAEEDFAEEIPAISSAGAARQIEIPKPEPRKKLSAPAAFGASLLSILISAAMLVFAALGGYLLDLMVNFIIGALQTLSTTTDALWMFAIGFVLGALGLLILWFSVWVAISLIHRLFFGKADKHTSHRLRLKKVWKTIWIIIIVLLVLGIGCGAAAYFMGGFIDDLYQNPVFNHIYSWIDNTLAQLLAMLAF